MRKAICEDDWENRSAFSEFRVGVDGEWRFAWENYAVAELNSERYFSDWHVEEKSWPESSYG